MDQEFKEVSQNLHLASELEDGLAVTAPCLPSWGHGFSIFGLLADQCQDFDRLGRAMTWTLFRFPELARRCEFAAPVSPVCQMVLGKASASFAVHRGHVSRHRLLFPLPLGDFGYVKELAIAGASPSCADAWMALRILGLNGIAGHGRADLQHKLTELQRAAAASIRHTVERMLPQDLALTRTASDAEKKLSTRFRSYTGEEVPKVQTLRLGAAKWALPPPFHGGPIDARGLVSEATRWFLEHPESMKPQKGLSYSYRQGSIFNRMKRCLSVNFFG